MDVLGRLFCCLVQSHSEVCVCVCVCVCMCAHTQSCLTLCDPAGYSLRGSSVHGIFQARILKWVAISFSRGSSRPRDWACVSSISCIAGRFFTVWTTRETLSSLWCKSNEGLYKYPPSLTSWLVTFLVVQCFSGWCEDCSNVHYSTKPRFVAWLAFPCLLLFSH